MEEKEAREDLKLYIEAHTHASFHVQELMESALCGCFYCVRVYDPKEIQKWIDEGMTAMCPHCGIDAVIGSAAGFALTEKFLRDMYWYWFEARTERVWPKEAKN